jgi:hypothetical protein
MIKPTFEVLNQRGTPMFFSDTLANRPAAAIVGRIFISTDTNEIYRDTGTAWNLLGGGGGTIGGSIATGQVAFGSASNTIAGTNNLFWDNSNARLGVGTNTPQTNIQISDNKNGITSLQISNTTTGNVSQAGIRLDSDASSGTMNLGKYSSTSLTYLSILANDGYLSNANFGDIILQNEVATGRIKFSAGGVSTPQMTIFNNGNVGIGGGLTDSGQKFQVTGTSNFVGNITLPLNQNAATGLTISNSTSGTAANSFIKLQTTNASTYGEFAKLSSAFTTFKIFVANDLAIFNANTSGDIAILNDFAAGRIKFAAGGSSTAQMTLQNNGNLLLGSVTDIGKRLHVTGDTLLTGSGSTGGTSALQVVNSSSQLLFELRNDRTILFSDSSILVFTSSNASLSIETSQNRNLILLANTRQNGGNNSAPFQIQGNFIPLVGNNILQNFIIINPAINQSSGANGITRGIYINPSLTSAFDWRSLQWDNNSGWGIFGAGTALNYLNGNLLLGSTSNTGERLQVTGTQITTDTRTYSSGAYQSSRDVKNLTFPSGTSLPSGGFTFNTSLSVGTTNFDGSITIPNSNVFSTYYAGNVYAINSAGAIVTSQQATGIRTISQNIAQNIFAGTSSGTFTHVSSIQILGFFNNNTGSIIPTITNAYQLLINNIDDYTHTFTFTNRWGIYQEGASDRNYLAGNLMLNSTTDTGERLQVTGTAKITSILSMGAGTTSNAQINLGSSTAPTSPNNGDIWFDGTNLFMRIGGVTKTFTII